MFLILYFFGSFFLASAIQTSKAIEGRPHGLLSYCPGSTKPAIITPETLKHLSISVVGTDGLLSFSMIKSKYNYFQTNLIAKDPNVDFRKKTLLFIGGYMDSPGYIPGRVYGKIYKNLGYNVLLLDLNWFTTVPYELSMRFVRTAGLHTAEMLANLTSLGLDPKKLELLGLSMGGQAISFIAKNYRLLTGMNISRLTALDPSGPCFRQLGPEYRLDDSDADHVEMIATNIDGFGNAAPVGHVNIYVNGGEYQPGFFFWDACQDFCSHIRVFWLWVSALVNPYSFIAMKCDSVQQARDNECYDRRPVETTLLGLKSDKTKRGIFYLTTDNNYPYYLGKKGLKKEYEFFKTHINAVNVDDVAKI